MKYLIFLLLTSSVLSLSAQSSGTYQSCRDCFVGVYEGHVNHSICGDTSSGIWSPNIKYLTITYSDYGDDFVHIDGIPELGLAHYRTYLDSVLIYFTLPISNNPDSVFYNCFGCGNPTFINGVAKLFSDSTFEFWYWVPPADGDYWAYFKGKKTKSYAGINNNAFNTGSVELYPNPAVNTFTIITKENIDGIEFYNLSGVMIKKIPLKQNQKEIDVSAIPKGLYSYKVFLKNHKFITGKVMLLK